MGLVWELLAPSYELLTEQEATFTVEIACLIHIFEKTAEIVLTKSKQSLTRVKHLTGIILCTPAEDHNPCP